MKDINAIHIIGAILNHDNSIEYISRRFICCIFDLVSNSDKDLPDFNELSKFIIDNVNTSDLSLFFENNHYYIDKIYKALRSKFVEEFELLQEDQKSLLSDVVCIEFNRRFKENIIGYDFQGWPVRRLTLKDILLNLGAKEHNGFIGFDLSDENLNKYPCTFEDDGMGYGINEQYIVEVDKNNLVLFLDSSDVELN